MSLSTGNTQTLGGTDSLEQDASQIHGIFVIEAAAPFHFLEGDARFSFLTGYTNESDFGIEFSTMTHENDYIRLRTGIADQLRLSHHTHHRFRLRCKDGSYLSVHIQGDYFKLKDGREILKCSIIDYTPIDDIVIENMQAKSDLEVFGRTIQGGLSKHLCDHQLSLLWANDYFYNLSGYTKQEWEDTYGNNTLGCIYQKDLAGLVSAIADITENNSIETSFRICHKNGDFRWIHATGGFSGEFHDNFRVINVVTSDITSLMIAEQNAKIATRQYSILSDISEEIAYEYSYNFDTLTLAKRYEKHFDFPQIIDHPEEALEHSSYISDDTRTEITNLFASAKRGASQGNCEFKLREKQGEYAWYYTIFSVVEDTFGNPVKIVGLLKNINSQKQNQETLIRKAQLDTATGLYNKGTTEHMIQSSLSCLNDNRTDAFMIIDIDDFKQINDTYGHLKGDEVICSIADTMTQILTTNDLAGRIGGDEFAIYFEDILDTNMLLEKADTIASTIRKQYPGAQNTPCVTLSIGIALARMGTTFESLLNDADTALYHAKSHGKNQCQLFQPEMERDHYYNERTSGDPNKENYLSLINPIVEALDRAYSTESAINQVLVYLGMNLPIDKIGIFEYTADHRLLNCTFQWNKNPLDSTKTKEQLILATPFEELCGIGHNGLFYTQNTRKLDMINPDTVPDATYVCQLAVTKIEDNHHTIGFISIASTDTEHAWSPALRELFVWMTHLLGPHIKKKASDDTFFNLRESTKVMLDAMSQLIYIVSKEGRELLFVNKAFHERFPETELHSKCHYTLSGDILPCSGCPIDAPSKESQSGHQCITHIINSQYEVTCTDTSWANLHDSYLMIATPIMEQEDYVKENEALKRQILLERQLAESSYIDTTTGYSNFEKFRIDAKHVLDTHLGEEYVLIYGNIKNFKVLNENYGHDVGDRILKTVCDVLNRYRQADEPFARVISDTFIILKRFIGEETQVTAFRYICKEIAKACAYIEPNFPICFNAGMLVIDESLRDHTLNSLIDRAVIAYKNAKQMPQGGLSFYTEELHNKLQYDAHLESHMEEALEQGEFLPYLQPKFSIDKKQIIGCEVLVRWKSPKQGFLVPDKFIPLFEKNGFITEIDLYMLKQACKLMRNYLDRGLPIYPCSVNMSRITLMKPDFIQSVMEIIDFYRIPTENIEFEVTENVFMEHTDEVISVLNQLKSLGFSISMDDFGSGYSSFTLLRDLPIDVLKLDKDFLRDSSNQDTTYLIMKSIIDMAHAMNLKVVCEGIETEEQADALEKLGCEIGQGYLFAKPMPVDDYNSLAYKTDK